MHKEIDMAIITAFCSVFQNVVAQSRSSLLNLNPIKISAMSGKNGLVLNLHDIKRNLKIGCVIKFW